MKSIGRIDHISLFVASSFLETYFTVSFIDTGEKSIGAIVNTIKHKTTLFALPDHYILSRE